MSSGLTWKSRPVFISSTFLDMQDERDFLRNVVFPELEERFKARRQHLEWIDLRVGVANAAAENEEAREVEILKVCLAEVKRSRPFLIALIGDRYGTVLPEGRITAATEEESFTTPERAEYSVTHLEIDFGVFLDTEQSKRSYFYFREPLPYAQMGEAAKTYSEEFDTTVSPAVRRRKKENLEGLKAQIKKQFPDRVRTYRAKWNGNDVTGFDELHKLVTEDLWRGLEAEIAGAMAEGETSWQQAERAAMEDFAEDRARDFIGRAALLGRIAKFAGSQPGDGPWSLCLTGAAGSGKSAVWGTVQIRLASSEHALVLAHAAGASPQASSVDSMLRRWIDELAENLGVPSGLAEAAKDEEVEAIFGSLLARAAQKRRVLVLVDALDQFEHTTRALHMTWLPRIWPDNARLLVTAIPGEASKALLLRPGTEELPVMPLDVADARSIVAAVCRRYHRSFEPEVIQAVVAKTNRAGELACGNALWLTMAVEELNLLDADDFARVKRDYGRLPGSEALRALMCDLVADEMPADIPGLYAWSFDRASALFGAPLTQAFLGAIAVSRGGWRESDFRVVLPKLSGEPWDELRFAQLRRTFRGQMRQRGALGQWDFAHGEMRPAAIAWLAGSKASVAIDSHTAIADHLLALPKDDPLHVNETMAHLMAESDRPSRARKYYGDPSLSDAEIDGATRVLAGLVLEAPEDSRPALEQVLSLLEDAGAAIDFQTLRASAWLAKRLLFHFDASIDGRVETDVKMTLLARLRTAHENLLVLGPGNEIWLRDLSVVCSKIGEVLTWQGHLAEALKSYRQGLVIVERLAKTESSDSEAPRDVYVTYTKIGDVLLRQGNLSEALASQREALAVADRLAKASPGNSQLQFDLGAAFGKIGAVLSQQSNLPDALKNFREEFAIADRAVKAEPNNPRRQMALLSAYNHIGSGLRKQGNLADALKNLREALAIAGRLAKADPANAEYRYSLALSYRPIGAVQEEQGDLPNALKSYRSGQEIVDHLVKIDPGNLEHHDLFGNFCGDIGDLLLKQGHPVQALRSYREKLAIVERLAKTDPGNDRQQNNLAVTYAKVGEVLVAQNHLAEALNNYSSGLAIVERLAKTAPGDVERQRNLLAMYCKFGAALATESHLADALENFRKAHTIADVLAKADRANLEWQRALAASYEGIGDILVKQGHLEEALTNLRALNDILQSLGEADHGDLDAVFALGLCHHRIGDVLLTQGHMEEALSALRAELEALRRAEASGYDNDKTQRLLSAAYNLTGHVLFKLGNLTEAAENFHNALAINSNLAKSNPDDADLKRDLFMSYHRIGYSLLSEQKLPEAMTNLRNALNLLAQLHDSDPHRVLEDSKEREDLQRIIGRLERDPYYHLLRGDALEAQGNRSEALQSFHVALDLIDREKTADLNNVDLQRNFIVACIKLADVDQAGARAFLTRAKTVAARMLTTGQLTPRDKGLFDELRRRLAALPSDNRSFIERALEDLEKTASDWIPIASDEAAGKADNTGASQPQNLTRRSASAAGDNSHGVTPAVDRFDESITAEVKALLDRGQAQMAREILYKHRPSSPPLRNLLAVCYLRSGDAQQALDATRGLVFPGGGLVPDDKAEPAWIINFATALTLLGDPDAGRSALRWLKDQSRPEVLRLLKAIDAWEKSLSTGSRFKRMFGGAVAPVHLGFPPGVY